MGTMAATRGRHIALLKALACLSKRLSQDPDSCFAQQAMQVAVGGQSEQCAMLASVPAVLGIQLRNLGVRTNIALDIQQSADPA